jgi:hypothetical protein
MFIRPLVAGLLLALPTLASAQSAEPRLETGVFFTFVKLEEIGSNDHGVGTTAAGLGGRVAWRLFRYVDLDSDLAVHPRAGVTGYRLQGFLGVKAGARFGPIGFYAKARPGFLYFEKDPFGVGSRGSTFPYTRWANSLEPTFDVGATIEYDTPRGLLVRFDLGDTIVRYSARTVVPSQHLPPQPVGGFTTRNRQWSLGMGKRF